MPCERLLELLGKTTLSPALCLPTLILGGHVATSGTAIRTSIVSIKFEDDHFFTSRSA